MADIRVYNVKISCKSLKGMTKEVFLSTYDGQFEDIEDAWVRAEPHTSPVASVQIVKKKKGRR